MHKVLVLTVVLGVLAIVGSAQAASWQVAVGEQARPPAGTPKGATLDAFFPAKLTINAGDSVTFSSATFHTVTYSAGKPPPGLFAPGTGTYDGLNDAAGQPFYFDSLTSFVYNAAAFAPAGGKSIVSGVPVSSGVLSPATPKSPPAKATYTFPKAGVYQLFCTVHPGMKATVVVKAAGAPLPLSAAQVTAKALTDTSAAWAKAKALAAAPVPKNTVYAGVGSSTAILGFFPSVLKIKAGTTVTFREHSPSEVHNTVFGPKKYILAFSKKTDLFPGGPGSKNQVTPVYLYGTEPKGGYTYDGTNHGNGFSSTPLTASAPHVPLPRAAQVTFSTPGTYKYFCFLHGPDMAGTVIVTP
jgi:plastocyanin